MRIKVFMMPGRVRELELADRATIAELLCRLGHYDDDDIFVQLNDEDAFPDDVLSEGDQVIVAYPTRGSAPLPPGRIEEGVAQLQQFTAGARELILIDPYLVKPRRGEGKAEYVQWLSDCTNLGARTLKRMRIVNSWWHHDADVLSRLSAECLRHRCELSHKQTNDIHDRVWIKDNKEAIAIGSSLNSVGSRLAFALTLPDSDLRYLLDFLRRHELV
jgi:hypothetical protein